MTPKEKAASLIKAMALAGAKRYDEAVACALIAVEEILNSWNDDDLYIVGENNINEIIGYWQLVKQEIEIYGEWY